MTHRIFLAGAAGAIGKPLTRLLCEAGHQVIGTTRSEEKAELLRSLGAEAVIVDVFDAEKLGKAVAMAEPGIVIHQLTDLPHGANPALMAEFSVRNARIRREGTANLVRAAQDAGVRRMVAQSIAWAYAPGPLPHREEASLDAGAPDLRGISVGGVIALENEVLGSGLEALVLRYGRLYGPGTGNDTPSHPASVHVDAAAHAAFLGVELGVNGVINVAEANDEVASDKATTLLGWSPGFRL